MSHFMPSIPISTHTFQHSASFLFFFHCCISLSTFLKTNSHKMAAPVVQIPAEFFQGDGEALMQLLAAFKSVNMDSDTATSAPKSQAKEKGKDERKARTKKQVSDNDEDGEKQTEEVEPTPPGMLGECKPLYQVRDKNGRNQWSTQEPDDIVEPAEGKATMKYAFLVRKKKVRRS